MSVDIPIIDTKFPIIVMIHSPKCSPVSVKFEIHIQNLTTISVKSTSTEEKPALCCSKK